MKKNLPLIVLIGLLTGCAGTIPREQGPSPAQDLANAHIRLRAAVAPQQGMFQQRIRAGMSQEDVIRTVAQVAIEAGETGRYHDGQPSSREFQTVAGANVDTWEYAYYDKVFVLSFQNGSLTGMATRPGRTLLGSGQ